MTKHYSNFCIFVCLFVSAWIPGSLSAGGPENLLLVVNVDSQDSLALANHYIHLRKIPPRNVVYVDGIDSSINIDMKLFQDRIMKPVFNAIQERGLDKQIDYVVYSAGFPTRVMNKPHVAELKKIAAKQPGFDARFFPAGISLNAATYFYGEFMKDQPTYMSFSANWYYRQPVKKFLDAPFVEKDLAQYKAAAESLDKEDYSSAIPLLNALVLKHPFQPAGRYLLAQALAKSGQKEKALDQLEAFARCGWNYPLLSRNDPSFQSLRDDPRFKKINDAMQSDVGGVSPTRGFSNRIAWGPNGWPNGSADQGKQLVLSTLLAVTPLKKGRGSTLEQAIEQLNKSVGADNSKPKGTFYFSRTNDVRSKTRQPQFKPAIRALKRLGYESVEIKVNVPIEKKDILGMTIGYAYPKMDEENSRFVPGAIGDNLTSHGGGMNSSHKQTSLTHFLENGAAGASGTVIEPFAIAPKFPDAMLHAHYVRGCTLAEAFYQSVQAPFQLLIVGDALCRPWGDRPQFEVAGIKDGKVYADKIPLQLQVSDGSVGVSRFEVYLDGKLASTFPANQSPGVDTSNLADGSHDLTVVAIDNTLIRVRSSKSYRFKIERDNKSVDLELAASAKTSYEYGRSVPLNLKSSFGEKILVYQNSRVIGEVAGRSGELLIDTKTIGQGPISLHAVVMDGNQPVRSGAIKFEVTR